MLWMRLVNNTTIQFHNAKEYINNVLGVKETVFAFVIEWLNVGLA